MSWSEDLTLWSPEGDKRGDEMHAGQQLNQARGYAEDAYHRARNADVRTKRIEALLKASLDPDAIATKVAARINLTVNADAEVVKQAVKDALAEGVE